MFGSGYTPGSVAGSLHTQKKNAGNKALGKLFSDTSSASVEPTKQQKKLVKILKNKAQKAEDVKHLKENQSPRKVFRDKKQKLKVLNTLAKTHASETEPNEASSSTSPSPHKHDKSPTAEDSVAADGLARVYATEKSLKPMHKDRQEMRQMVKMRKEKNKRTVFVGNLPNTTTKKTVTKLFREKGAIEAIRFRSAAPANPKMPKKGVIVTKEFHPKMSTFHAYVVFTEESAACCAQELNGTEIDGLHVRVDYLGNDQSKHDHKRSIFFGNLPFDAEEEAVRDHFSDCGDVENVRIIRDNFSRLGKGFGYVLFKDKDSVSLALKLNEEKFRGRKMRIERSSAQPSKTDSKTRSTSYGSKSKSLHANHKQTGVKRKHGSEDDLQRPAKKKKKDKLSALGGDKSKVLAKLREKKKKKLRHRLQRNQKQDIANILTGKHVDSLVKTKSKKVKKVKVKEHKNKGNRVRKGQLKDKGHKSKSHNTKANRFHKQNKKTAKRH